MRVARFLLAVLVAVAAPAALSKTFADEKRGVSFNYPDRFQLGQYKGHATAPSPKGWTTIAVLVESKQLKGVSPDAIPNGEIPTIEFIETTGLGAQIQLGSLHKPESAQYKRTFGKTTAYKLPGAFGPYGDQALFYLVKLDNARALMVMAHKYYFTDPAHSEKTPVYTKYDEAIDALLATLVVKSKQ